MKMIKKILMRLRGQTTTEELVKRGLTVGKNFSKRNNCQIDGSHAYMITIGDHVTLAGEVTILGHDASTKMFLGYTKIAPVVIGDHVFIGERAIILPGVKIGDNCIIGAGSVVTKDIPSGSVAAGNPAKVITTLDEYIDRQRAKMSELPVFGQEYVGNISREKMDEIKERTTPDGGFIV